MNNRIKKRNNLKLICGIGVFAALAIVVGYLTSPIKVDFLSFDAKDIIIVLASFIYGPIASVGISAVAVLVEFLTYSTTGVYGLIMNFASSLTFSFVASFIYSRRKTFGFAIIGIYGGVVAVTSVMMALNLLVTPYYMGVDVDAVIQLLPTLLLPFNLAKAIFNGGAVLLLYKPVVTAMRRAHLMPARVNRASQGGSASEPQKETKPAMRFGRQTVLAIIIGAVSVAVAVVALVILAK